MFKIRPLANRILVSMIKPSLKSEGGIHFPDNKDYRDDRHQWRVLAIGPKVKDIAVGDHVLCPMYTSGCLLDLEDGTQRMVIDAKEAIAVWRHQPVA